MSTEHLLLLVFILPGVIGVIIGIYNGKVNRHRTLDDDDCKSINRSVSIADDGLNANNSIQAEKRLYELKHNYSTAQYYGASETALSLMRDDIQDVEGYVHDIKKEEWEDKAETILCAFLDEYNYATGQEGCTFSTLEDVMKSKGKCLRLWNQYWRTLDDCEVAVHPKEFMKEYLAGDFDPCMEDSAKLKQKIEKYISTIRPEYKRKMALFEAILKAIEKDDMVMRAELLKRTFAGSSDKEVASCYRALVSTGKVVEIKLGNRYFSSLSDKEKMRMQKSP